MLTIPVPVRLAAFLLLAAAFPVLAQYENDDAIVSTTTFDLELDKKEPSYFHRPARATPGEQLEYADSLLNEGRARKAAKAFLALVHTWHDTPEAAQAQYRYARILLKRGRHADAFRELQYIVDHYAGYIPYYEVLSDQFRIANYLSESPQGGFLFFKGAVSPKLALPLYEQIVANAPNWEKTPEAQFRIGAIYEQEGMYDLAIDAYEAVQLRFSNSDWVSSATYRRAYCLYRMATRSPRDEERTRKAIGALIAFQQAYPTDANAAEAATYLAELKHRLMKMYLDKARFYDKIAKRPEAAVIAYGDFLAKFPTSEKRAEVESRIEALQRQVEIPNE